MRTEEEKREQLVSVELRDKITLHFFDGSRNVAVVISTNQALVIINQSDDLAVIIGVVDNDISIVPRCNDLKHINY